MNDIISKTSMESVFVYYDDTLLDQNEPIKLEIENERDIYEHNEVKQLIPWINIMLKRNFLFKEKPDERGRIVNNGKKTDYIYFNEENTNELIEIEHKKVFFPGKDNFNDKDKAKANTSERIYKYLVSKINRNSLFMDLKYTNFKKYEETKKIIETEVKNVSDLTNFNIENKDFKLRVCPIIEVEKEMNKIVDKQDGFYVMYHIEENINEMFKKLTVDSLIKEIEDVIDNTKNKTNSKFKNNDDIFFSILLCSVSIPYGFELLIDPKLIDLEDIIFKANEKLKSSKHVYDEIDAIFIKRDYDSNIYKLWVNEKKWEMTYEEMDVDLKINI